MRVADNTLFEQPTLEPPSAHHRRADVTFPRDGITSSMLLHDQQPLQGVDPLSFFTQYR